MPMKRTIKTVSVVLMVVLALSGCGGKKKAISIKEDCEGFGEEN